MPHQKYGTYLLLLLILDGVCMTDRIAVVVVVVVNMFANDHIFNGRDLN